MAVEAVVALMVDKLAELLSKDSQLLGLHGEINRIQEELNQMRPFLKDADIKQKEVEVVRDWMEDIRDVCFDVDDVIDSLGQGQAAQGRHGFVERLKRCISDQITRYKVGKEIERIKLSIKGIKRSRESYRIREINEERQEATSSTQCLQEVSRSSAASEKIEIVITTVDDQLTNEERTRDIDEGRQKASSSSRNLQEHRRVSTLPGEPEEVGLQEEINTVGQQLIEEEPRLWDGTRDISEGKLEASSSTPGLKADRVFSTLLGDSEEVGLQEGINTVGQQFIKEKPGPYDGTRDFDEGRLEASSSAPSLRAESWFSTMQEEGNFFPFFPHSSGWSFEQSTEAQGAAAAKRFVEDLIDSAPRLQEINRCSVSPEKIEMVNTTVNDQLTNEERTRDIDEGRQEASSSSRNLQAHRRVSTLAGEPEEVGLQEEINTVGQQLIEEEPRLWDGTRDISEGKLEARFSTTGLKADRRFSTLLGDSEEVGLQEGINTVGQQLVKEEPGPNDGTDIDEGRLEASSSAPSLQAYGWSSTLLGESEEVGLQEGIHIVSEGESSEVSLPEVIDTVSEQSIKEEPGPYDGTRYVDERRFEATSLAPIIKARSQVGLQEEIDRVSEQLIKEEPSPCDGTRVIDEGPECRDGSMKGKKQPKWTEQVLVSSGSSLEVPPGDGHSWKKYGQKDIRGEKYPRAYYRCTHRLIQRCEAKKQVQRSEEDPSKFQVKYTGHHTCMQATNAGQLGLQTDIRFSDKQATNAGQLRLQMGIPFSEFSDYPEVPTFKKSDMKPILGSDSYMGPDPKPNLDSN